MTRPRPFRWILLAAPAAWLLAFFALPFAFILKVSLSQAIIGQPPYTPLFDHGLLASFENYGLLFEDSLYVQSLLGSVGLAGVSTLATLALGYPMAFAIAGTPRRWRAPLLALVALPFVTSFLIRVYAWMGILRPTGVLSELLQAIGFAGGPVALVPGNFAVLVGMTYTYLPFMVLPIYASLEKIDPALTAAAADLGARPMDSFLSVTLPLSLPGVLAGALLVFVPSVGEFVVPELLGGPGTPMIGRIIWQEFFNNRDWPLAAALSVVLLLVLAIPIAYAQRAETSTAEGLRR
jgi:putrescine transport system permease protein